MIHVISPTSKDHLAMLWSPWPIVKVYFTMTLKKKQILRENVFKKHNSIEYNINNNTLYSMNGTHITIPLLKIIALVGSLTWE